MWPRLLAVWFFLLPLGALAADLDLNAELKAISSLYDEGSYVIAHKRATAALEEVKRRDLVSTKDGVRVLNALGNIEQELADYENARKRFTDALKISEELREYGFVMSLNINVGRTYFATGEFDRSLEHYRAALKLHETLFKRKASRVPRLALARIYEEMARVYHVLGNYTEAIRLIEMGGEIRTELDGADGLEMATTYSDLATMKIEQGDYVAGRALLERSAAIARKLAPKEVSTGNTLVNLAALLANLGKLEESVKLFEEAYAIQRGILGDAHPQIAITLGFWGLALESNGKAEEAMALHEKVLAIREKRLGKTHFRTVVGLINLGRTSLALGKPDKAESYFSQAIDIWKKQFGEKYVGASRVLAKLAAAKFAQGKDKDARSDYSASLTLLDESLGSQHPITSEVRNEYGVVLAASGDADSAWAELRKGTTEYFQWIARVMASSTRHEQGLLLESRRSTLFQLLSLANAQSKDLTMARAREALLAVLGWKAASSRAMLDRQEALVVGSDDESKKLLASLKEARRKLVHLMMYESPSGKLAGSRKETDELLKSSDALELALARRTAAYATLRQSKLAGLDDLARRLGNETVLVEAIKYRDLPFSQKDRPLKWGKYRYGAFLLWSTGKGDDSKAEVKWVDLGDAQIIEQAIHAWRKKIKEGAVAPRKAEGDLRARVWDPIAAGLPKSSTKNLRIAPDGELSLLPFEAIATAPGQYLVEKYEISYLSSGRDLIARPGPTESAVSALVLGDPDFDHEKADGEAKSGTPARAPETPKGGELRFFSLDGFRGEIAAIQKLLQQLKPKWDTKVSSGSGASEGALAKITRPAVLYAVTHGFFLPDRAKLLAAGPPGGLVASDETRAANFLPDARLQSGLALAGANVRAKRAAAGLSDGLLTALEVEALDLWGTELVVLSACETGLGNIQIGEGVMGLRHSFQQAGARTVVSSLWKVPDAETEQMMKQFLEAWLSGKPKAEALRRAQLDAIKLLRKDSPDEKSVPALKWAAFTCHGDRGD